MIRFHRPKPPPNVIQTGGVECRWDVKNSPLKLKTHPFHKFFPSIVNLIPSGLPSWILTCTALKGHWRLFVLVFFLATCARKKLNIQLSSPR